jgi:hypothetical protein
MLTFSRALRAGAFFVMGISLASCGSSSPVAPEPGLALLSGTWTGTLTATQAGRCTTSAAPRSITTTWVVTDAGEVVIRDGQGGSASWIGTSDPSLRVRTTRESYAQCSGVMRTYPVVFTGIVSSSGSTKTVDLEALEEVCPPECVFRVVYRLTKQ